MSRLGGLYSAIFNEVLQFFLIWLGALAIPVLGMIEAGGWTGLAAKIHRTRCMGDYMHLWSTLGTFSGNPMGVHWTGIVFGLGGVIAFGYWTTDFLVVQRAMAAKDLRSAQMAPIIASYFKMVVPADRHSSRATRLWRCCPSNWCRRAPAGPACTATTKCCR